MPTLNMLIETARTEIIEDQLSAIEDRYYAERVHALDFNGDRIYTINAITGEKTRYKENPPCVDTKYYAMNTETTGHWAV